MNLAIVGLDHWYTAFAAIDAARNSDAVRLVGVAELRPDRTEKVRERFPDLNVTDDPTDLLTGAEAELVAICATTAEAPALARTALQNGKHVLSVKPPARTLAELDEVIDIAEENGKWYGSFEGMQRLQPRNVLLRELIAGGAIGSPISYHQTGHGGLPSPWPNETGMSWWRDAAAVPGGAWIDHAIYAVDLARFVFGGEVTRAVGLMERHLHREEALEDYGVALLQVTPPGGQGIALLIEDTWAAEPGSGFHQQLFLGTRGHLRPDGRDWVVVSGGKETRHAMTDAPFFDWAAFLPTITGEVAPVFGPEDARANLAACLEVYESAAR
ncbi:MAG: Gfo/Idh/MocA family oxidoreductase [Capsulimonadales bacterium]|nr:Gfo/Idh/MocA family oxidoreductase [Capsulimonadales bacterium]